MYTKGRYQKTMLSLTQLDNQGTLSSTEERLKEQNPMLRAKPCPLLSAVLHAAHLYPLPDTQGKFKSLFWFVFPAIAFWKTRVHRHIPDELMEANAALALGPFEQHQSSLGFPRILHNFWTVLSVWHARHPLGLLTFLPHKTELFSLLNLLH